MFVKPISYWYLLLGWSLGGSQLTAWSVYHRTVSELHFLFLQFCPSSLWDSPWSFSVIICQASLNRRRVKRPSSHSSASFFFQVLVLKFSLYSLVFCQRGLDGNRSNQNQLFSRVPSSGHSSWSVEMCAGISWEQCYCLWNKEPRHVLAFSNSQE